VIRVKADTLQVGDMIRLGGINQKISSIQQGQDQLLVTFVSGKTQPIFVNAMILREERRSKMRKIRIAVAVNSEGDWHAVGDGTWDDEASVDEASANVDCDRPYSIHFVEVEVPLPTTQIYQGNLVETQEEENE
jgi:hypothetical protein